MFRRFSTTFILVLVIAAIAVSAYFYTKKRVTHTIRATFTFETTNEKIAAHSPYNIESRYLPKKRGNIAIRTYIDDLLLGPITEHCKPIFDTRTRLLLCTKRSGTLKIDLSREAWLFAKKAADDALKELQEATEAQKSTDANSSDKPSVNNKDNNDNKTVDTNIADDAKTSGAAAVDPQTVSENAQKVSMITSMDLLSKNIKNNFPAVKSVVITIDGSDPLTGK